MIHRPGQIKLQIRADETRGVVQIEFKKATAGLTLPPSLARSIADALRLHADKAEGLKPNDGPVVELQ